LSDPNLDVHIPTARGAVSSKRMTRSSDVASIAAPHAEPVSSASRTHLIVLPGGGYARRAPHEADPIAGWLAGLGFSASVFLYPLKVRHPAPLVALREEIERVRAGGAERIGAIGFSAGGHLAGLAALAPGGEPGNAVDFAVLGYAITSMETDTYRPAREILLGEDAVKWATNSSRQTRGQLEHERNA
jgi:acetyl esterase/lipase